MMHGPSLGSLQTLTDALDEAIGGAADKLGPDLFGACDVIRSQAALRRAMTDPTMPREAREKLAAAVFESHVGTEVAAIVAKAASLRWAASGDLAVALEQLGVRAVVKQAGEDASRVESELFIFGQAVEHNAGLRDALSDPVRATPDKQALVRSLLEDQAARGTLALAERTVSSTYPTVTRAVASFVDLAAEAGGEVVALVRVAGPLTEQQESQLAEGLSHRQGTTVHLNVVVDPDVVGGVRVEIGGQVIDGTILSRLDEARRRLAG